MAALPLADDRPLVGELIASLEDVELAVGAELPEVYAFCVGASVFQAFALMSRESGLLLVLPDGALADEDVAAASDGSAPLVGPSQIVEVPFAGVRGGAVTQKVRCTLVDVGGGVCASGRLLKIDALHVDTVLATFDTPPRVRLPHLPSTLAVARDWVSEVLQSSDIVAVESHEEYGLQFEAYYTATEEAVASVPPSQGRPVSRGRRAVGSSASAADGVVSALRTEMAGKFAALETALHAALNQRSSSSPQAVPQSGLAQPAQSVPGFDAGSAFRRPEGTAGWTANGFGVGGGVRSFPVDRALATGAAARPIAETSSGRRGAQAATPTQLFDIGEEDSRQDVQGDPMLAVMAALQSQGVAVQALLAQRSQGSDDLLGLADASGSSAGVRGAAGRQRLQDDLIAHPGRFGEAIRHNMQRRGAMDGWSYLERFGATTSTQN